MRLLVLLFMFKFYLYFFLFSYVFLICIYSPLLLYSFGIQPLIPYFSIPCPWPHYNLKRPFDPHVQVFVMWLSILESCQVYVVFVFMGALRVNSSLDTWEIECISYEALSLFILELIDYLAMFEMLGWFLWRSWFFNSLRVGCYPFFSFLEIHWEICNCCCVCLFLFNVSCFVFFLPRSAKV